MSFIFCRVMHNLHFTKLYKLRNNLYYIKFEWYFVPICCWKHFKKRVNRLDIKENIDKRNSPCKSFRKLYHFKKEIINCAICFFIFAHEICIATLTSLIPINSNIYNLSKHSSMWWYVNPKTVIFIFRHLNVFLIELFQAIVS